MESSNLADELRVTKVSCAQMSVSSTALMTALDMEYELLNGQPSDSICMRQESYLGEGCRSGQVLGIDLRKSCSLGLVFQTTDV